MTKIDIFQAHVGKLLQKQLNTENLSEQEKTGIKISVYGIFEKHLDLEELFYELLDYLEDEADLPELIDPIENFYSNL